MGRSRIAVTADMLPHLRKASHELGIEVLAKESYDHKHNVYIVGIQGESVPDADLVTATFQWLESGPFTVIFEIAK